ncbi:uncharacterized protein Z518_00003 [Rhinocladiella mackenziei CBS 650.93]|uniref:Uncharacterized protein n=1 Tax=Rhinocladiella mackenziei CBS 650.93 TaxID=1442369 RepID=A0A0D2JHW3_9EURO|nr:uncharacterized protein Z518_00003 [Rhinocladiella mackenziei CBS 650.93]KIX08925.1 hypothetical protein Z518_00003 [Rhinocladiella mackenziei CBS 650.93]
MPVRINWGQAEEITLLQRAIACDRNFKFNVQEIVRTWPVANPNEKPTERAIQDKVRAIKARTQDIEKMRQLHEKKFKLKAENDNKFKQEMVSEGEGSVHVKDEDDDSIDTQPPVANKRTNKSIRTSLISRIKVSKDTPGTTARMGIKRKRGKRADPASEMSSASAASDYDSDSTMDSPTPLPRKDLPKRETRVSSALKSARTPRLSDIDDADADARDISDDDSDEDYDYEQEKRDRKGKEAKRARKA